MTRICFERIYHLGLEKTILGFEQQNRAPAERNDVSVPAGPIRVIGLIVVHPCDVFGVLSGRLFCKPTLDSCERLVLDART